MKQIIFLTAIVLVLTTGLYTANAKMMEKDDSMMQKNGGKQQEENQELQEYPYMMEPGMMGGYGMGPGMMGGYGMGPGMMRGYGRGPGGKMGGYGTCYGPGPECFSSPEQFNDFLDKTRELRRELHGMRFEYGELMRNPKATREKRKELEKKMFELQQDIREKAYE